MTTNMFRICTFLALGLAASAATVQAQDSPLTGVWHVNVAVVNCQTGAPIRNVVSLQEFHHDGSITETANTASRGMSEGVWSQDGRDTYTDLFWFFRYTAAGTFASLARGTDKITLGADGHFTSIGMVEDFDANGVLISTGCVTHAAVRLAHLE